MLVNGWMWGGGDTDRFNMQVQVNDQMLPSPPRPLDTHPWAKKFVFTASAPRSSTPLASTVEHGN